MMIRATTRLFHRANATHSQQQRLAFSTSSSDESQSPTTGKQISLGVNVQCSHPLGTELRIMSGGSCYLLAVDNDNNNNPSKYQDFGWLDYIPRPQRPRVHVLAASHVLSPFLWREYYPYEELQSITLENLQFGAQIYSGTSTEEQREAMATIPLKATPIHHPNDRDIALIHFENEHEAFQELDRFGVTPLHWRPNNQVIEKDEELTIDGFEAGGVVYDFWFKRLTAESKLVFKTKKQYFASTNEPLPEGMCGAPVIDGNGALCGTIEGIVPVDHPDKSMAGCASFLPAHIQQDFVEYAERQMLKDMIPYHLFNVVVYAKNTSDIIASAVRRRDQGEEMNINISWKEARETTFRNIKESYGDAEVEAILEKVGTNDVAADGDPEEIIEHVQTTTLAIRDMVHTKYAEELADDDYAIL